MNRCANRGKKHNEPDGSERGRDSEFRVLHRSGLGNDAQGKWKGKDVQEHRLHTPADRVWFVSALQMWSC